MCANLFRHYTFVVFKNIIDIFYCACVIRARVECSSTFAVRRIESIRSQM